MLLLLAAIESPEDSLRFEAIYKNYRDLMYYTARKILGDDKDAEDIVHDAFVAVIAVLMILDLTDADETRQRAMPFFVRTMEDIFSDMEKASLTMRINGGTVTLTSAQQRKVQTLLAGIDMRALQETDAALLGTWKGPIHIVIELEDIEKPCRITLVQVSPQLYEAPDRIYRLGFTFENGEEYAYTCDEENVLPLTALCALVEGNTVVWQPDGSVAAFIFDLSVHYS